MVNFNKLRLNTPTYHKIRGVIRYDPNRNDMKNNTEWWCVIEINDDEITRYYRWWVMRERWIDLKKPSWGTHVSIIRGEKPRINSSLWKAREGKVVTVKYKHEVKQTINPETGIPGNFWFLEVECKEINEIREELGLPIKTLDGKPYKYHITIGRTY